MKAHRHSVAVGLSGGVDSSVAAALLKEHGYDVTGITMRIFDGSIPLQESGRHGCYGPGEQEDIDAAASVCRKLDIPFHIIDLRKEYRHHVIDYFRREYLSGRTPNPCIVCNRHLKFGFLLQRAREAGVHFEIFATGHYARIGNRGGRCILRKAVDTSKDQTYFLYTLTADQLSHIRFPLGAHLKRQTREMARDFGLETADRVESQDFVAGGNYAALFDAGELEEGDIVDEENKVIGRHRGIIHYTLGQRQGLGIAAGRPLYVLGIDAGNNRIIAGGKERLYSKGLIAGELNLIPDEALDGPRRVKAKIRLNHREVDATVFPNESDGVKVIFDEPQMAVSPGQSVVMYVDDVVLGGGIIEEPIQVDSDLGERS